MPPASSRNIGNNYVLAFDMGEPGSTSKLHLTLLYINNVKRGYEQDRVKALATELMEETALPEILTLEFSYDTDGENDRLTDRCVRVRHEQLAVFQIQLYDFLRNEHKLDCRPPVPLHVDLRGTSDAVILKTLSTRDNWYH